MGMERREGWVDGDGCGRRVHRGRVGVCVCMGWSRGGYHQTEFSRGIEKNGPIAFLSSDMTRPSPLCRAGVLIHASTYIRCPSPSGQFQFPPSSIHMAARAWRRSLTEAVAPLTMTDAWRAASNVESETLFAKCGCVGRTDTRR